MGRKVLLVEDNLPASNALQWILKFHGFTVVTSACVKDAVSKLANDAAPDIVLLDVMLPDGDGGDVLKSIRQAGLTCKVLVMTGCTDDRLLRIAEMHPDSIMTKPIGLEQLMSNIKPA